MAGLVLGLCAPAAKVLASRQPRLLKVLTVRNFSTERKSY
jgi:hypothetical protein